MILNIYISSLNNDARASHCVDINNIKSAGSSMRDESPLDLDSCIVLIGSQASSRDDKCRDVSQVRNLIISFNNEVQNVKVQCELMRPWMSTNASSCRRDTSLLSAHIACYASS